MTLAVACCRCLITVCTQHSGTGKTAFACLLMNRWACEGTTVLLRKAGLARDDPLCFNADGRVRYLRNGCSELRALLHDPDVM